MQVILGVLLGVLAVKILRRHRWRRGWRGPWRGGMFWRLRRLGLDRQQMNEVETVWTEVHDKVRAVPFGRYRILHEVMDVASADTLDRGRLDELATRWTELHAQAARGVADAVARLHEILRPEQRARLRDLATHGPAGGPYR